MEPSRVLITTVVWNHRDRLPLLLRSIEDQTRRADQVIVLDAASQDGVSAWLAQSHPQISTLRLFHHHGLSHMWRQAAKFALQRIPPSERERSWIFFVSPEVLLAKDVCERLLKEVERRPEIGAIGPAVLRAWYQGEDEDGLDQIEPTELVESLGFRPLRSFSWRHRGQGGSLHSLEDELTEVFALSPAAVAYRADILTQLIEMGGFSLPWKTTDALFFDLGWRLHWLETRSYILPDALTWRVERKGDGTHLAHWTERVVHEQDRRLLVRLHLFGIGTRLRTVFPRFFEGVRSGPYRLWCALTRSTATEMDEVGPDGKAAIKQAKKVLRTYQKQARQVFKDWILVRTNSSKKISSSQEKTPS